MADLNDDITRYLAGRMTPAEMHALEKKALDDPFLAETLAGAETISPDVFAADVTSLRDALKARTSKGTTTGVFAAKEKPAGRQVSFWTWPMRIAAGMLMLISAAFVIFFIADRRESTQLALQKQSAPVREQNTADVQPLADSALDDHANAADQPAPADQQPLARQQRGAAADTVSRVRREKARADGFERSIASADAPHTPGAPPIRKLERTDTERLSAKNAPEETRASGVARTEETPVINAPVATSPSAAEAEVAVADEVSGIATDAEGPPADRATQRAASGYALSTDKEAARAKAKDDAQARSQTEEAKKAKSAAPKNVFTGKVVASDGSAIPGVNVIEKGTNTGTVTDIAGNFQLALDDDNPVLVFSFIGYTSIEEEADKSQPVTVTLDEDTAELSEVVVMGYGAQRDSGPIESTYEFANPAGGRRAYKQYLEKNLHYPQEALINNVEGRVTIQFAVETTGALSDFKVVRGIGSGCDEEVIRLIKSGPKWAPTKRDDIAHRDVIRVRMKFQLPKDKTKK